MNKQKLDRANVIVKLIQECEEVLKDNTYLKYLVERNQTQSTFFINEELVEVMKDSIKNKMQSLQKEFEEL